jgi:hypothetical protein
MAGADRGSQKPYCLSGELLTLRDALRRSQRQSGRSALLVLFAVDLGPPDLVADGQQRARRASHA